MRHSVVAASGATLRRLLVVPAMQGMGFGEIEVAGCLFGSQRHGDLFNLGKIPANPFGAPALHARHSSDLSQISLIVLTLQYPDER